MAKFKQLAREQFIGQLITEFVNSNQKSNITVLNEGLDTKSNLFYAIQLGEQTAKQIQVDIINEYLNDHPVLKEDIFQRGLAKTKSWLTTPLGKGFGQAKDTQTIQNLFAAFKKNTEKIVAQPNQFTPSAEDAKNAPAQIGLVSSLIGKRFANLQNNPRLNVPATPAEQQAGMGRIEQLISKLRSSGLVKGADKVLDEIGIFARQHPTLTNMIIGGLVTVLTLSTGPIAGIPMLAKFVIGVALRTFVGVLKGEKATQAATKAAVVSGAGIALGKILGLFYDKLASWLNPDVNSDALSLPVKPGTPQPGGVDLDTSHLGREEYLSSYRQNLINKALNAASSEEYQTYIQQVKNTDAQYGFNGEIPEYDPTAASGQLPAAQPQAPNTPYQSPEDLKTTGGYDPNADTNQYDSTGNRIFPTSAPVNLQPKLSGLNSLMNTTDVKGATAQSARQAVQNWVNSISQPEAQAMLKDPNISNQLMRKGALSALKKKFNIQESELDMLKAELVGSAIALTEANPFTAAKNFMFGGPKVGGKNAGLDYKQVESDYLKFLNNMRSVLGLQSEKDVLDTIRRYDKTFPGVYDYVKKVRDWLYGATPESNEPTPPPVLVPPQEEPKPPVIDPNATQPPQTAPGTPAADDGFKMDSVQLKNVKLFLTQLIELGNILNKANAQNLDKATLKSLATSSLNIGDILVNKKGVGKSNQLLDKVLQGIDILGPLPPPKTRQASTAKPVSSIFTEEETGYKNPELTKQISALKASPIFKGLQQRIVNMMSFARFDGNTGARVNNLDNPDSIIALRKVLSDINDVIIKFSPQVSQKLGANPTAIKKELESDKGFLKEVASEQQRVQFTKELTAAMPLIIALMVSLRQAFNRKNPNNIYKHDAAMKKSTDAKKASENPDSKPKEAPKAPNVSWTDPRSGRGGEDDARMEESKYKVKDYRKFF